MKGIRQVGLGWRPDLPDYRDKVFLIHSRVKAEDLTENPIPASVSLRASCSPVRDQGQLGSCTGFAHSAAVEYLYRIDDDPKRSTIYSPLWMYWQARFLEESVDEDAGAFIRDGAKILANIGIPPESVWPYRADRFMDTPTKTANREASRWKVGPYYRCATLNAIKVALAHGFGVVGGFSCYSNMFTSEVDQSGDVPLPGGGLEGGHAVQFIGYDDNRGRLLFKNSWTEDWGDGGFGSLPYEFVQTGEADDFWAYESESPETKA
jgi:C1A family cysteine protease